MLKNLRRDNTVTTPYVATKDWNLSNVDNEELVLAENGNTVAAESLLYHYTYTETSSLCSVAKEEQENDLVCYREGLKLSGLFYPNQDPQNLDGTYKRVIYNQFKTMFYNNYKDPTKIWGMEKIDFDTSEVKKFLSDNIRVYNIPSNVMGESILKGSVTLFDYSLNDDYTITDDGKCNLFAGTNLFSKVQEIGDFSNIFLFGNDGYCNHYFGVTSSTEPPAAPVNLTVVSGSSILNWNNNVSSDNVNFYVVERSLDGGVFSYLNSVNSMSGNIVTNGGFETGDFTGWKMIDNTPPAGGNITVDGSSILYRYNGNYGVKAGPRNSETGYISQTLYSGIGNSFILNFWMNAQSVGNIFQIYWEGNLIGDLSSELPSDWTQYAYIVSSTSASSELKFLMQNETDYFGIDDISMPIFGTILSTVYVDTDVTSSIEGTTYWYRVAAVNQYGTSSYSNTADITFTIPT